MASNTPTDCATVYVPLLDEDVEVWRPVEARRLSDNTYLILNQDYDRILERWVFEPGTRVTCRQERRDGRSILVATAATSQAAAG
jgi:hypothetical protein